MNQLKSKFLWLILFLGLGMAHAQKAERISLIDLLQSAEQNFDVKFNYLNETLVDVEIALEKDQLSLESLLQAINKKTILQVNALDEQTYVINKKPYCVKIKSFQTNQPVYNFDFQTDKTAFVFQNKNQLHFSASVDTLTISKKGFADENILPNQLIKGNCQTIYINKINTLAEVIVQNFLTKGLQLQTFGKLQLQPTKFEVLPGLINADVLQTAAQVPGIFSIDERISNISVRGGTHDQNLFLWNGARLYQTGHFFGMISALNPSINREIDIYKNASPAKFSRGISSVFDISSNSISNETNENQIAANTIAARFKTDFSLDTHQQFSVSARRSFTDLYRSPTYDAYFDKVFQETALTNFQNNKTVPLAVNENFWFFDTAIGYTNEWDSNNQLNINALAIGTQLHFEEINQADQSRQNNELDQDSYIVSADFNHRWNRRLSTSFQTYFSYYQQNAGDNKVNTPQQIDQLNRVLDAGIAMDNTFEINQKWQLNGGYQFSEIGIRNDVNVSNLSIIKQQKNVLRRHHVYASTKFSTPHIQANLGTNAAYFEAFDDFYFSPRLSLETEIIRNLTAQVNGELKYQASSQVIDQQQDFFSVAQRRWVLANGDNIPIQESLQFDAGFTYQNNNWLFQLTGFQKQVNGINSRSQGFTNQLELLDLIGNYEVSGVEFFAQHQINNWRIWNAYTFQDNNYEFSTFDPVFFTNNFERTHQLSAGISYTNDRLLLSLGTQYFTGKPFTPIAEDQQINAGSIDYLLPNSSNLNDYWQVNLTVAYRQTFQNWRIKTGLGILNVTDQQQITEQFYRLQNDEIQTVQRQSLGFAPNLFMQVYF